MIVYVLGLATRVPQVLITLSGFLEQKLGPEWWKGTPLERFAPKQ